MGYAGGSKPNPTYHDLGDHAETVQIDYDPAKITYETLLHVFWTGHDPTSRSWSRQYASIIFVHDEEQQRLSEASKAAIAARRGRSVSTEIIPYRGFTMAEDYHQKHSIGRFPEFEAELKRIYPRPAEYVASTAVARVNGYLGGDGFFEALMHERDSLGLSPAREEELLGIVQRRRESRSSPSSTCFF